MRGALVALALLLGCAHGPIPVRLVYHQDDFSAAEMATLADDASSALGVPIELVDHRYGAITVDVHSANGRVAGRELQSIGCARIAWSEPDPLALAHEIGHTLGLQHVDEPGNLMHPFALGDHLDGWQMDHLVVASWHLRNCR